MKNILVMLEWNQRVNSIYYIWSVSPEGISPCIAWVFGRWPLDFFGIYIAYGRWPYGLQRENKNTKKENETKKLDNKILQECTDDPFIKTIWKTK